MNDKKDSIDDTTSLFNDDFIINNRKKNIHEAFNFWKNISSHSNSTPTLKIRRRSSAIFKKTSSTKKESYHNNTVILRNRANTSIQLNSFKDFQNVNEILKDKEKGKNGIRSSENLIIENIGVMKRETIDKAPELLDQKENQCLKSDKESISNTIESKTKDENSINTSKTENNDDKSSLTNTASREESISDITESKTKDELSNKEGINDSLPEIKIHLDDTDNIVKVKSKESNESSQNLSAKKIGKHRRNVSDNGERNKKTTKRRSNTVFGDYNEFEMNYDLKAHKGRKNKSNESKRLLDTLTLDKRDIKLEVENDIPIVSLSKSKSSEDDIHVKEKGKLSKRNSFGGDIYHQEKKPIPPRHSIAHEPISYLIKDEFSRHGKVESLTHIKRDTSSLLESFFKNRQPSLSRNFSTFGIPLDICVPLTSEAPEFVVNATTNLLDHSETIDWKDTFKPNDLTYKDLMVIKKSIDSNSMDIREEKDTKIVANALLLFFTELKEPLCTSRHYNSFLYLNDVNDEKYRFRLAHSLIHSIPGSNRSTFRFMVNFIDQLSNGNSKKLKKLCTFFAPSFFRLREETNIRYSTPAQVGNGLVKSSSESNMKRRKSEKRQSDKPRRKHVVLVSKILHYIVANRNELFNLVFKDKIFAWSKGHLYVEAASLEGLIELLTDELYIDNDFPNIFFLNSIWLFDPIELFDKIMEIYEGKNSNPECSVRRRAKILMILKLWFKIYGQKLINNQKLVSKVSKRADKTNQSREEVLFWKDLHNTLNMHKSVIPIQPESPKMASPIFDFDIFDYDPTEVARAITLIDIKNFKAIRPEECLQKSFCDEKKGPNFFRMASSFNTMNLWVQTCIVNTKSKKDRASLIGFFTSIMTELIELQNFNGSLAIFTALTSTGLSKLTKTWSKVGRKFIKILENAEELFSMRKNCRNYQLRLKECHLPAIPQIVFISRNLFAIEENMETKINNMVNFEKMRSIYNIIKEIQKFQKSEYNFERVETLISKFDNLECKTEDEILDICQTLELKK